eukprot:CAMPEP_0177675528 /NCGR_PEP_ID=MMETSP0447-20121125/27251_1 /TAXON_ID=0 /ORGANISM="Stygamoeba regulata, Strain BSH-02190019" /LENGTH=133 /DNA_ID=CAMNT_0019183925 /DNA_START=15 /DNA_END=416 /DNA_ORIENTATION=-
MSHPVTIFGRNAPANDAKPYTPDNIVKGNPVCKLEIFRATPDGRFMSGIWSCTKGEFHFSQAGTDETCTILEGSCKMTATPHGPDGARGAVFEYRAGESFVIPGDFVGFWETTTDMRKVFSAYTPANAPPAKL